MLQIVSERFFTWYWVVPNPKHSRETQTFMFSFEFSIQRTLFKTELQAVQEKELIDEDVEPIIRKSK